MTSYPRYTKGKYSLKKVSYDKSKLLPLFYFTKIFNHSKDTDLPILSMAGLRNFLWKTLFFIQILWISCQHRPIDSSGKTVFRMNLDGGLSTLDPAYARDQASDWMTAQVFNGLVELDSSLRVRPALAHRWEVSEDGLTYQFFLRPGVYFHPHPKWGPEGPRRVIASDFVYSFTRICDPQTASTGQWVFNGKIKGLAAFKAGDAQRIVGFQAPDDSTFIITLSSPFPPLLGLLAMPYGRVVPKEIVEALGDDFRRSPVGTGPFLCYEWRENDYLILHKNESYFERDVLGPLPHLDAIKVSFIFSRLSAFIEFNQGKLDMLNGLDDSYKDEILQSNGEIKPPFNDYYQVFRSPQLNTEYLGMLVDSAGENSHPLKDPGVRKALNLSIDREQLVTYLLNGMGYPAHSGFIPKGMPGFNPERVQGFSYQPDSARKLLGQYMEEKGDLPEEIILYSTQKYARISEFIQKSFENIGLKVSIQNLQGGALRKEIYGSRIQFWRASWIADYPDGENYLALFYGANQSPNGPNTTHFNQSEFDALYDKAMQDPKDSTRYLTYQQMERIMLQEAPIIPLYYDRSIRLVQPHIKGLVVNPMNHLVLKYVRKAQLDN